MSNQDDASGHHDDSDQSNANAQPSDVSNGIERQANNTGPNNGEQYPGARKKPPIPIRIWRALWRKRIFWHPKPDRPHVNWAEITTVCLTIGIVIAAFIQAFIYWRQAGIMERSLEQNQQSIALNTGQVAIAGRNAQTAANTLVEMKSGGTDTHALAEAAGKQATNTEKLAMAAGKQADAARVSGERRISIL